MLALMNQREREKKEKGKFVYLKDREKKAMAKHSNMEIGMEFHGLKNWNLFNRILYLVPRHLALFPFLHKVGQKKKSVCLLKNNFFFKVNFEKNKF
jgi:hypothetical protein